MATDEELREALNSIILKAVNRGYNAGLTRAAKIARAEIRPPRPHRDKTMSTNEHDIIVNSALGVVAAAIEAERGQQ